METENTAAKPTEIGIIKLKPLSGVLPPNLPTLFADGIANITNSKEVVKFVLFRTDGDISDRLQFENVGVGQIVMTMSGFVYALAFLEKAKNNFLAAGFITEEQMDKARKLQGLD
jgi:hypothetical protein